MRVLLSICANKLGVWRWSSNLQPTDDYVILTNANLFSDVGSAEKTNYIAEFSDAGGRITSNTQSVASNLYPKVF